MGLDKRSDDGILNLIHAIMHSYRRDINDALRIKNEDLRDAALDRLRYEAEVGMVGSILELMDVDVESVIDSVRRERNGRN